MSNLRAEFYKDDLGRELIDIKIIGDKSVVTRKATDLDKIMFPNEYDAYTGGKAPVIKGTPLTDMEEFSKVQAARYVAQGVRTIEEFVALSDIAVKGLGIGSIGLQKAARRFIEKREKKAVTAAVTSNKGE